jgi:hypothetical protein
MQDEARMAIRSHNQDHNQAAGSSLKPVSSPRVSEVLAGIVRCPGNLLWRQWNWKSALFSSIIRGAIFFSANLLGGTSAAVSALVTDLIFRPFVSGFNGAIIESFRSAEPPWAATVVVIIVVPVINHLIEIAVHWTRGTQRLGTSVIASVSFSVLSGLFNIFAMRRGVLIVGPGRHTVLEDLRCLPGVIAAFLMAVPRFALGLVFSRPHEVQK